MLFKSKMRLSPKSASLHAPVKSSLAATEFRWLCECRIQRPSQCGETICRRLEQQRAYLQMKPRESVTVDLSSTLAGFRSPAAPALLRVVIHANTSDQCLPDNKSIWHNAEGLERQALKPEPHAHLCKLSNASSIQPYLQGNETQPLQGNQAPHRARCPSHAGSPCPWQCRGGSCTSQPASPGAAQLSAAGQGDTPERHWATCCQAGSRLAGGCTESNNCQERIQSSQSLWNIREHVGFKH